MQENARLKKTLQTGGIGISAINSARPMGYIGYLLARKTEHEGMITGKVGMKNKFFDYS